MDNNNKKNVKEAILTLLPSTVALIVGLCMILSAAFLGGKKEEPDSTPASVSETVKEIFNNTAEYYVIRDNGDGSVSVYMSDGSLYRELGICAALLSGKDRELLKIGIMAKSDSELEAYIEGLCG